MFHDLGSCWNFPTLTSLPEQIDEKMNRHKIPVILSVITLLLTVIACSIFIGGPDYPTPTIAVSTEAVGEMQQSVETAVAAGIDSGRISLSFTESQLTSYLYYKLQAQQIPMIEDPQIFLRDDQLQIFGRARSGYFVATASVIFTVVVDDQGQLLIELSSADFGPLPAPEGFKDLVTTFIKEAYIGALGPAATGFRLESVVISDGTMVITGNSK
jgi:hypothetical protein